jgi:diamine N-acetyltransferase
MRELAEFEGYSERFAVTEADLVSRGLHARADRQFSAWVADDGGLQGYAVVYVVPFTFDLRPTVVLKELFVASNARQRGLGRQLLATVIDYAKSIGARLVRWQVLPSNGDAKRFYASLGGAFDAHWENWQLELPA